jgi:hypothetical protein
MPLAVRPKAVSLPALFLAVAREVMLARTFSTSATTGTLTGAAASRRERKASGSSGESQSVLSTSTWMEGGGPTLLVLTPEEEDEDEDTETTSTSAAFTTWVEGKTDGGEGCHFRDGRSDGGIDDMLERLNPANVHTPHDINSTSFAATRSRRACCVKEGEASNTPRKIVSE